MLKSLLRLHFLSLLFICCVSHSTRFTIYINPLLDLVACRPHQIQAFTQFKNEFDTRGCNHSDNSNGVWCDNSTGAVTKLQLRACLSGTLKPNSSLFGFHQLRYLVLSENNFTSSSLPSEFGNLSKLEVLALSSNGFLGQFPSSFNNLSMLSALDLSNNHLSGTLNPNSSLFELHHLRFLDLSVNNFSSPLPSEFGKLNKLEVLYLFSNSFIGQVPPTFSNLTLLSELLLGQNKLTGNFPPVQNLTKLIVLDLSYNHFTGTIPSSLLAMPFLFFLVLTENHFSGSIEVPNSSVTPRLEFMHLGHNQFEGISLEPISKLINLKSLDLSFSNISYPLDLSLLSSLKYLWYLDLSGNSLSLTSLSSDSGLPLRMQALKLLQCNISEFPNILKPLQNLEFLDISENRIEGKVPAWIWSLPRLDSISLANNLLSGFEGSTEVLVNSSVTGLDLSLNHFRGPFPKPPLSINALSIWNNSFTGNISLVACNRSSLTTLDLSYNNFTGPIPQCLSNYSLITLNLRKNNLEGSLPDMFHDGASLRTLDVGYNQLAGKLPRSLLNCSSLKFVILDHNRFRDTFPFWLKALPGLQALIIRSNKFYGPISRPDHGLLAFPKLRILEISDNNFTGSLPPNYFMNWGEASSLQMDEDGRIYTGNYNNNENMYDDTIDLQYKGLSMEQEKVFTSYATIDLSGNRLEGQIPESIGLLKALIALNLSNNAFTGHIPLSLANLKELESLDMSRNQLSGTIPNGLGSLSFLAYINVSHNQLKGEIPQGPQITGQSKSSFEGNVGLCGLPLKESCFGTSAPPMQHHKHDDEKEEEEEEQVLNWKAVAIGYGSGVLLGLVVAQVIASYKPEWLVKIMCLNKRRNR